MKNKLKRVVSSSLIVVTVINHVAVTDQTVLVWYLSRNISGRSGRINWSNLRNVGAFVWSWDDRPEYRRQRGFIGNADLTKPRKSSVAWATIIYRDSSVHWTGERFIAAEACFRSGRTCSLLLYQLCTATELSDIGRRVVSRRFASCLKSQVTIGSW